MFCLFYFRTKPGAVLERSIVSYGSLDRRDEPKSEANEKKKKKRAHTTKLIPHLFSNLSARFLIHRISKKSRSEHLSRRERE